MNNKFKLGDEVFLFEIKEQNKNGIRIKLERSKIVEICIGGSGGLIEFDGYRLANGSFSKGKNLYTKEEIEAELREVVNAK